ncbi:MAG: stage III sporulation protein AD [Lachnospiraceae bacterium]|nr:stage III sporulation protein AD [Lachnospiraceae bacterium]MBQ8877793.1 stage III sporulation protein AD [Lachnospiraceae bacterium]
MDVVKIGVLGLAGVMLALQFKSVKPEISIYMGLAVGIVIFCFSVDGLLGILDKIQSLQSYIKSGEGYFGLLFKAVGVTYICEFTAAVCKDAGYGAVAGQIEIFGKLTVLFMGMPALLAIIENISAFAV